MLIILFTRAALFFSLAVSMYFLITCIPNNFMYIQLSSHPYSFSLFRKYQAEAEAEGKGEQEHAAGSKHKIFDAEASDLENSIALRTLLQGDKFSPKPAPPARSAKAPLPTPTVQPNATTVSAVAAGPAVPAAAGQRNGLASLLMPLRKLSLKFHFFPQSCCY